jgi:aryl-phospho-beta-D-glucosidase BglC (GH1 family)
VGSRRAALLGRLACLALVGAGAAGSWILAGAGAAPAAPRTLARTEAASDGPLHTVGTTIEDTSGHPVQLTGLNVTGLEGTNPQGSDVPGVCHDAWKVITGAEVNQIASYGFATVRLPIAWADVEPTAPRPGAGGALTHTWNTAYLDAVRADVAHFARHHIRVI